MKNLKLLILTILTHSLILDCALAQDNVNPRIIGGEEIDITTRPFQVNIRRNSQHQCGGSILNESWIITAAHCVDGINQNQLHVAMGITNQNQAGTLGQIIDVRRVVVHPNYNSNTNNNDIALLELTHEVDYNNSVQSIRLINIENQHLNNTGRDAYASGWGWTSSGNSGITNHLRGIEIPVISNQTADHQLDRSVGNHSEITGNMIATGFNGPNRLGPCHGDSGGPLTTENDQGISYLIGLVSWGVPRCVGGTNSPTIYTNILNYENWIYRHTCQENVSIDDPILSDVLVEASNVLSSSNLVGNDLIVDFRAGQQIVLSSGFEYRAVINGEFHASIGGGNCEDRSIATSEEHKYEKDIFLDKVNGEINNHPNPSNGYFWLTNLPINNALNIKVYNSQGKLVYHTLSKNASKMEIDLRNRPKGVYFLNIIGDYQTFKKKIVIN